MTSTAAPAHPDTHWDQLAFFLGQALSLFGDPAALAQRVWFTRRDYTLFSNYIRPLEDFVRRLILIAALKLAPMALPPAPERKFRARAALPANTGAYFDPAKPQTWRVSFKLSTGASASFDKLSQAPSPASVNSSACLSRAQRVSKAARTTISSAPSAQRLEALLRAYENRDKLAAAMARKIARDAEIARPLLTPRKRKRTRGPAYVKLPDLTALAIEAHERYRARTPASDSS